MTALYIIQVISCTYQTFVECHVVVRTLTCVYIHSAIYVLIKMHGFIVLALFLKGEGISSVPDTACLGFCLANHPSYIFGGMFFLSAVLVVLQLFLPWMRPCTATHVFAPVVVTSLTYICKIITHCLATPSVLQSILVHLCLGPKQININYILIDTLIKLYFEYYTYF